MFLNKKIWLVLRVFIFAVALSLFGCHSHGGGGGSDSDDNEDSGYPSSGGGSSGVSANQFFWGTWQKMSDGTSFTVYESYVESGTSKYNIASSSDTYLSVTNLGQFDKSSENIIISENIPYFRKGGTNLTYKLRLVGMDSPVANLSVRAARAAGSSFVGNRPVTGKSKTYPSYSDSEESDENGDVTLKSPVAGDVQIVTVSKSDGTFLTVTGIKVDNTGSNMGTIPIVEEGQYALKITGEIEDSQKTGDYLYGDGFDSYPLTLTITNITDVECTAADYEIEAEHDCLEISGAPTEGVLQTLPAKGTRDIKLMVKCGQFSGAYIDTGINVTIKSGAGTWKDYIPLRFYKGVIPITVKASTPATDSNTSAKLNGFVIYPDGNSRYFSVANNATKTIWVPSFGNSGDKDYVIAFSGATVTTTTGTEMFYSLSPASLTAKELSLKDAYLDYKNHTEENAKSLSGDFEAYLKSGAIDFYSLSFKENDIHNATEMPRSDWYEEVAGGDEAEEILISTYNGWTTGTLATESSYAVYRFWTSPSADYTIFSTDSATTNLSPTGRIYISAGTTPQGTNLLDRVCCTEANSGKYTNVYSEIQSTSSGGWCYIKIESWSGYTNGTYGIKVCSGKHSSVSETPISLTYVSGSGYSPWKITAGQVTDKFSSVTDSAIYYFFAEKNQSYSVSWEDKYDGSGDYSADIKVSASTSANIFDSSKAETLFFYQDKGYSSPSTVKRATNGYIYLKVQPYGSEDYAGNYAIKVVDSSGMAVSLKNYAGFEKTETLAKGSDYNYDWVWGAIYAGGYETLKFPVEANTTYNIIWQDSDDSSGNADEYGNVTVTAASDENFSKSYWTKEASYTTAATVKPESDGFVYVKISYADKSGSFYFVATKGQESLPLTVTGSHNCHFDAYSADVIPSSAWVEGNFSSKDDDAQVYFFKAEKDILYHWYADTKTDGSGKYTGDVNYAGTFNPSSIAKKDVNQYLHSYSSGTARYSEMSAYYYIVAYPGENLGTFAFAVVDYENSPVQIHRYTMFKGSDLPSSAWKNGELKSKDDVHVYRIVAKPYQFFKLFWDDKTNGSGKMTGNVQLRFSSQDDTVTNFIGKNGYTDPIRGYYASETIVYLTVSAKSGSDSDVGTFALAAMDGNDAMTIEEVSPNATFTVDFNSDLKIEKTFDDAGNYTFSASGTTFDDYDTDNSLTYTWYLNGKKQKLEGDTSTFTTKITEKGVYEIYVEGCDLYGDYKSATIFVHKE